MNNIENIPQLIKLVRNEVKGVTEEDVKANTIVRSL
jgi:hypothetical protein